MNKRQLKKVINSRRLSKVMIEGTEYFDAACHGRKVIVFEYDEDGNSVPSGVTADIAEVSVTFLSRSLTGLRIACVGGKASKLDCWGDVV